MPRDDRTSPERGQGSDRVLVIVPTYDEALTLPAAVASVLDAAPQAHVLVVDDASPDGTGRVADGLAADDPRVAVLHRTGPRGLGRAYLDGFDWALAHGYDLVLEMDADGSHPADHIPALVAPFADDPRLGAVIGSRWVPGGEVADWSWHRRLLSRAANSYARVALRLPVRDLTAGFRAYRAAALADVPREGIVSRGYCFQIDMTVRVADAGWAVAEVPITFRDRRVGESKMSGAIVLEAMWRVTAWGLGRLVRPRSTRMPDVRPARWSPDADPPQA